ncbi:E3 ubiquitin-protein ligase RNF12-like [Mytilus californianus]|uniref:E3 ubiquitin-protein ligase RNF12-like n=1 Tax=Mytilus californianus TaxID=6549 RepID=UPI00224566C3|nr:E3 ubiquitin-protein ligase RNF12-like [Mytilus californianus]
MASGGSNNRPYSLSKDEALARMLQEEEYNAVNHEDEQLARRLQGNMMFGPDADSPSAIAGNGRPPMRAMTPITQLFSTLVNASLQHHPRQARRSLGLLQLSSDEEDHNDSDSDSTVEDEQGMSTSRTGVSSSSNVVGRGALRGGPRGGRGRIGFRPSETLVNVSSENTPSDTARSMFSVGSDNQSSRSTTSVRGRPPRGTGIRGTRRGTTTRRAPTTGTNNSETGEPRSNAATSQTRTIGRTAPPRNMEPSVPPLSLAINRPELPDGEVEPEILILDRGGTGSDARFLHIMRDPMLLLLFLMGRTPHLLVPDDIDPTDYEALWDLAERIGEVKTRGLSEKDLESLSTKKFKGKTKFNQEGPQCQVCLSEYKTGDALVNLPCKHEYHDKCIKEWLKRNASCPICRHEIKSNSS